MLSGAGRSDDNRSFTTNRRKDMADEMMECSGKGDQRKTEGYVPDALAGQTRTYMRFIMWALNGNETALAQDLVNIETRQRADQPHVSRWLAGEPIPIWVARAVRELAKKAKEVASRRIASLDRILQTLSNSGPVEGTELCEACKYVCSFKDGDYGVLVKNEAEREARRLAKNEIYWGLLGFAPAKPGELNILTRAAKIAEDVDAHLVVVFSYGRTLYLILVNDRLKVQERYERALDEIHVHVRKMVLTPEKLWNITPLLSPVPIPPKHHATAPHKRLLRRSRQTGS
jgi:hypothetical protein